MNDYQDTLNCIRTGHTQELTQQAEVGDIDTKWGAEYGSVWRLSGCLGVSNFPRGHSLVALTILPGTQEDILWVSDPKVCAFI